MKILQGKIFQGGQVVLDNLTCKIQFHTGIGGIRSWAGRFDLAVGQSALAGDYRLLLENGWSGMISITKILPEEIHFVGKGPLEQ
jgi:hypothetical protein